MDFPCEMTGNTCIIRISGDLDELAATRFRRQVEEMIQTQGIRHLIVDLQGVSFVDSSGLGALFGRYKAITSRGGSMQIVAARQQIRSLLELSGVPKLIPVHASEREALTAAKGGTTA